MATILIWYIAIFLLGILVGGYLNLCISRLPYEKNLLWPTSRCNSCLQRLRWIDQIPVVSYLLLGGKCRTCRATFPMRYLLVELFTGLAFVALFHVEMVDNWLEFPMIRDSMPQASGVIATGALGVFFHHAILLSFLIVASVCDLLDMEIPLSVTLTGMVVGLVLSVVFPWPFPETIPALRPGQPDAFPSVRGVYAWPVWYPLPGWLPAGSWQLGLATGVAGAAAGMIALRMVRFLFTLGRGIEGLGVGDADLMMMAGAFIGWQPVILAFFVSVFPALIFAVATIFLKGEQALPFGPSLAMGTLITLLCWPALGMQFRVLFFDPMFLGILSGAGCVSLLVISFFLRLVRGT